MESKPFGSLRFYSQLKSTKRGGQHEAVDFKRHFIRSPLISFLSLYTKDAINQVISLYQNVTTALVTTLPESFLSIIINISKRKFAGRPDPSAHELVIRVVHAPLYSSSFGTNKSPLSEMHVSAWRRSTNSMPATCQRANIENSKGMSLVTIMTSCLVLKKPSNALKLFSISDRATLGVNAVFEFMIATTHEFTLVSHTEMDLSFLHKPAHRAPSHCHRILRKSKQIRSARPTQNIIKRWLSHRESPKSDL